VLSDINEDSSQFGRDNSLEGDSLLAKINPEIHVIQKIYKVILQRHEFVHSTKQPYTKGKH